MTKWPDPTTGQASSSQEETTTVNALGQTLTATDRNGSVHTLSYDVLGRLTFDSVTTPGAGVDGSVRLIEYAYDGQGNLSRVTSYDGPTGGANHLTERRIGRETAAKFAAGAMNKLIDELTLRAAGHGD